MSVLEPQLPRPVFSSVVSYLQAELPIFVPCFNNPTYVSGMISQLRALGFLRIVLLDGGSEYPPMHDLLVKLTNEITIVSLSGNPGPHHIFLDEASFALLPRYFCVTDPDLALNPMMPRDFLGDLAALAARQKVGKAGLALDISDREAMRDELFLVGGRACKIWEWEEPHWVDNLQPLRSGGDPVYRANIDTTFALYDKVFFNPANHLEAIRVAGRFTCRHLPWYSKNDLPYEEENFYRQKEKFSNWRSEN
jgi:hypothetical protein